MRQSTFIATLLLFSLPVFAQPATVKITAPQGSARVEQTTQGTQSSATIVASFDGLGAGFKGPQGTATLRNPSDNSLAVGRAHVMQTVNTRMAIFDKQGKVLYGPVPNNTVFKGFGGACESTNNGDTVVRYDQLADRWLIVMPTFRRGAPRPDQPQPPRAGDLPQFSVPGQANQPGAASPLYVPPVEINQPPQPRGGPRPPEQAGVYSMCYAISTSSDPMGSYYRYEFLRPLFPDYPRPAIWTDGYYLPTSTSDDLIQRHACVVERDKLLKGESAREQCVIIDGINFLNNADIDGQQLPPQGAPNIMLATGGAQLKKVFEDDGIYAWKFKVDWQNPANTKISEPQKIGVAPYRYLCDGQLTNCVPQPGTPTRLDSQGDKLMARVVYRRFGKRESLVAAHSINTNAGAGGVRWYEFRLDKNRAVQLHQQGTYAPDGFFRWLPSPAMDKFGNIGIGYSFGGTPHFAGQRFTGRRANDALGKLTLRETVLAEGQAAQTVMRWEDYTQTAVDPADDCTIWYVGDYLKQGETNYSTRIAALRMPGCKGAAKR